MKILLINPGVNLCLQDSPYMSEPLGLLYLAAAVRKYHAVGIVDDYSFPRSEKGVLSEIESAAADVVGISVNMAPMAAKGLMLLEAIKRRLPHVRVICGGNHATFLAADFLRRGADAIVTYEGEDAFAGWVAALEAAQPVACHPNIRVPFMAQPVSAPVFKANLDELAFPARDLLPSRNRYEVSLLASRGCAFNCPYCSTRAFWGKRRVRSVRNLMEEIAQVRQYAAHNSINFADDLFVFESAWLEDFCRRMRAEHSDLRWGCSARIDLLNEPLIEMLAGSGCTGLFLGVESGSDRILRAVKRSYTAADIRRVFALCVAHGITPIASFMIGLPGETREDVEKSLELASMLPTWKLRFGLVNAYPGTRLYEEAGALGVHILSRDYTLYDTCHIPTMRNDLLSTDELLELSHRAYGLCQEKKKNKSLLAIPETRTNR